MKFAASIAIGLLLIAMASVLHTRALAQPATGQLLGGAAGVVIPDMSLFPGAAAPTIRAITPVEPDGTPWVRMGDTMIVEGDWSASMSVTVVLGHDRGDERIVEAQVVPIATGPYSLEIKVPMMAAGPGAYHVWVVSEGGWSEPASVYLAPQLLAAPKILFVVPQVPWQWTTLSGEGFVDGAAVVFEDGDQFRPVLTERLGERVLRFEVPAGIKPGSYSVRVHQPDAPPSQRYVMQVMEPVPLDLYWQFLDKNGMPKNPRWGWQLTRTPGDPDYAVDAAKVASVYGAQGRPFVTQPTFENVYWVCSLGAALHIKSSGPGHSNWMGATYEGKVRFSDVSGDDGDVNLYLETPQGAGATTPVNRNYALLMEMDGIETWGPMVMTGETWFSADLSKYFKVVHSPVKPNLPFIDFDKNGINSLIGERPAIVSGLVGLDTAHDDFVEIHPIWAMAVDVGRERNRRWALFARNWGDEGYCGPDDMRIRFPSDHYIMRLPWEPGAKGARISTRFYSGTSISLLLGSQTNVRPQSVNIRSVRGDGIYIIAKLGHPSHHPLVWGDVEIEWLFTDDSSPLTEMQFLESVPPFSQDNFRRPEEQIIEGLVARATLPDAREDLERLLEMGGLPQGLVVPEFGPVEVTIEEGAAPDDAAGAPYLLAEPPADLAERRGQLIEALLRAGSIDKATADRFAKGDRALDPFRMSLRQLIPYSKN